MRLPEVQDTGNLTNGFQGYDQSHEDFMSTCVRCWKSTDAATKIGFGGFAYVARVLGMSQRTIYTGIGELEAMGNDDHPPPIALFATTLFSGNETTSSIPIDFRDKM